MRSQNFNHPYHARGVDGWENLNNYENAGRKTAKKLRKDRDVDDIEEEEKEFEDNYALFSPKDDD